MATTLAQAKAVLTDPERFDFPMDVSHEELDRSRDAESPTRSPHPRTTHLGEDAVARGLHTFDAELSRASAGLGSGDVVDGMQLLREPVALSTCAAVLPDLDDATRHDVALRVLDWIDSLGPVIAGSWRLFGWSRARRRERACRSELHRVLRAAGDPDPAVVATVLAAGIQVPIAAGAWLLVELASNPALAEDHRRDDRSLGIAWEVVRLCPPTWFTARLVKSPTAIEGVELSEGDVVLVSPLLLGRRSELVPGGSLDSFDPARWAEADVRPGAWLPFGAGPHACPGRNLGLAQLTSLAGWARDWRMVPAGRLGLDQSRGIFPSPARLSLERDSRPNPPSPPPTPSEGRRHD